MSIRKSYFKNKLAREMKLACLNSDIECCCGSFGLLLSSKQEGQFYISFLNKITKIQNNIYRKGTKKDRTVVDYFIRSSNTPKKPLEIKI